MRITCRWGLSGLRTSCRVTSYFKGKDNLSSFCLVVTDTGFLAHLIFFFFLVRYSIAMSLRIPRFVRFTASACDEFSCSCDFNSILVVLATARVFSIPRSLLVPAEVFLLHHGTSLLYAFLSKFLTLHKSHPSLFAWRRTHLASCRSLPIVTGARKPNGRSHNSHEIITCTHDDAQFVAEF